MAEYKHKYFERGVKKIITVKSHSVEETVGIGRLIGGLVSAGDFIGLNGMLGAGKTQFARGVAEGLGGNGKYVSSPTFVLIQEYEDGRIPLVHIDAYRLSGSEELEGIGWGAEMLNENVVLCEWAEKIESELPLDYLEVEIEHGDEGERVIHLHFGERWEERINEELFKDLKHGK